MHESGSFFADWDNIFATVIREECPIYYLSFRNFITGFNIHGNMMFPLFMPDSSIVGARVISKKFIRLHTLQSLNQYINNIDNDDKNAIKMPGSQARLSLKKVRRSTLRKKSFRKLLPAV